MDVPPILIRPTLRMLWVCCAVISIGAALARGLLREPVVSTLVAMVLACVGSYGVIWNVGVFLPKELPRTLCPRCRRRTIERVTFTASGVRFYRCPSCGARFKGASRLDPLEDASGPEDDAMYVRRTGPDDWEITLPLDAETYWLRTVDTLLRNQRCRKHASGAPAAKDERPGPASLWDPWLDGLGSRTGAGGQHRER